MAAWTDAPCTIEVQIDERGFVNIVHGASTDANFQLNARNWFRVRWESGAYPSTTVNNCGAGCSKSGTTCLCSTQVASAPAFTESGAMPTRQEVEQRLRIGSSADVLDQTQYTRCTSVKCSRSADVTVYLAGSGVIDSTSVFEILVNGTAAYFRNVE